jgi:DNA-binding transcriptional ArsR family regulator
MPGTWKPKPAGPEEALMFLLQRPLRKQLLRLYVEEGGMLSPKELAARTKQYLSNVSYHVRVLAEYGAVELVKTQPRRGSIEHFYKATSLVDDVPWGRVALGLGGKAA